MNNKIINWKEIYKDKALFHIYLTERKKGKSDCKAWSLLESITSDSNIRHAWIRRRWHDSLLSSKPFFQELVYKYTEKHNNLNSKHFEIKEPGVFYQGKLRIYFFDLFSYQKARGGIGRITFQEIVYEEAIPIDQEFLFEGGRSEQWMFRDLIDSIKRNQQGYNAQLKITFLANPYLWSSWFLDPFKNLNNLRKQALIKQKNRDNSGILEIIKDKKGIRWLLYLNLVPGSNDPHSLALEEALNPSLRNWDDFMIDEPNKYQILHSIQDYFFCEIGERKKFKKYCLMHFTKNHKEINRELINFCFDWEEQAKSKLENCLLREKKDLIPRWIRLLKAKKLYFRDYKARDWFLEMIK